MDIPSILSGQALGSWDYVLWGLVALALLIYLFYALIRAERF